MGESDGGKDKHRELEVKVNVTVLRKLNQRNNKPLYDGLISFLGRGYSYSLTENLPEESNSLEGIAEEIKRMLLKDFEKTSIIDREDLWIVYGSDTNESIEVLGSRGYTGHEGSFSRRQLNNSEMEKLIRAVDKRVRPLFYNQ